MHIQAVLQAIRPLRFHIHYNLHFIDNNGHLLSSHLQLRGLGLEAKTSSLAVDICSQRSHYAH